MTAGYLLTFGLGSIGVSSAYMQSNWLGHTMVFIMALTTAYSLPPFAFKYNAFWALISICIGRGLISNAGLFLHFMQMLGGEETFPPHAMAFAISSCCFCINVSLLKDLPDMEGDKAYGVKSLGIMWGPERVINLAMIAIIMGNIGMIIGCFMSLRFVAACWVNMFHVFFIFYMLYLRTTVDPKDQKSLTKYYMNTWNLFYGELLMFPTGCFV